MPFLPLVPLAALGPPDRGPTDEERALAAAIRDGDHAAFRAFFDRHHGPLYGFLRRRGTDPTLAEELVQQAFVALWEARRRIDPARSLRAYLFRTAITRAANAARNRGRTAPPPPTEPPAADPMPDADAHTAALREALERAVAALPERRRATFDLCFGAGLSYREAAEVLGVSVKTVEHQMGHALRAVRTALAAFHEDAVRTP